MVKEPIHKKAIKKVAKRTDQPKIRAPKIPKEVPVIESTAVPYEKPAAGKNFYTVGRRKTAVAQITISSGDGKITVNELPFEKYFMTEALRKIAHQPLSTTGLNTTVNVRSKIHGGGIHAQAESLRHAIARGILMFNPEARRLLKKQGFLTRDSRVKERKKPGLKRARRAPQFSKR